MIPCPVCGKEFAQLSAMEYHHLWHVGFECQISVCRQKFPTPEERKKHYQVAHNDKSHDCPRCLLMFTSHKGFLRHKGLNFCKPADSVVTQQADSTTSEPISATTSTTTAPSLILTTTSQPTATTSKLASSVTGPPKKIAKIDVPPSTVDGPSEIILYWDNLGEGITQEDMELKFGSKAKIIVPNKLAILYFENHEDQVATFEKFNKKLVWNQVVHLSFPKLYSPTVPNQSPLPNPPVYCPTALSLEENVLPATEEGPLLSPNASSEDSVFIYHDYDYIGMNQKKILQSTLITGWDNQTLFKDAGFTITNTDLMRVTGWGQSNWVNDNGLDYWFHLLQQRSNLMGYLYKWPKLFILNTEFFPKFCIDGFEAVKRWTKNVDLFSFDLVLFPVPLTTNGEVSRDKGLTAHWILMAIDFTKKNVLSYDSLKMKKPEGFHTKVLEFLELECEAKLKPSFDRSGWKIYPVKKLPQQEKDDGNCGVFVAEYAERLSTNQPMDFLKESMPGLRLLMAVEILNSKIVRYKD